MPPPSHVRERAPQVELNSNMLRMRSLAPFLVSLSLGLGACVNQECQDLSKVNASAWAAVITKTSEHYPTVKSKMRSTQPDGAEVDPALQWLDFQKFATSVRGASLVSHSPSEIDWGPAKRAHEDAIESFEGISVWDVSAGHAHIGVLLERANASFVKLEAVCR